MKHSLTLEAHAKINLTLEVLGLRPDGYHDLRSVVTPIPLHDDVEIEVADGVSVSMSSEGDLSSPAVPEHDNLAYRAALVLQRVGHCRLGAAIAVRKRIPAGAGLGGGSADAAAVLRGLNELWGLGFSIGRLAEIGAEVGSDVPALVMDRPVLMEGRGERVTPLEESPLRGFPLPDASRLVLRVPPVFCPTPAVFREFRESDRGLCVNDLQPAACRLFPQIAATVDALVAEGYEHVSMTGSGSAVFGYKKLDFTD